MMHLLVTKNNYFVNNKIKKKVKELSINFMLKLIDQHVQCLLRIYLFTFIKYFTINWTSLLA